MNDRSYRIEVESPDILAVSGALTFETSARVLAEGTQAMVGTPLQALDLGKVESVDSAGLACVLALMAEARRRGRTLSVRRAPDGLLALARVSDVDALLREH